MLAAALATMAVAASTGPCLGSAGPTCHFWPAKVVTVNDGDTLDADLIGDRSKRAYTVRLSAIQALELKRYNVKHRSGECHAVEATERLEQLLRASHMRIRLSAEHPGSRYSQGRLARFVAVRRGGRWVDAGELLVREGHAFWMASSTEKAFNQRYNRAQQLAARDGHNLWDPSFCGGGPLPLRLWAQTDPTGDDNVDVNGEWVKLVNDGDAEIALGGWWLREAGARRFTFPAGAALPAHATVTLYMGHGTAGGLDYYWGQDAQVLWNATNPAHLGGGVFLFDRRGDVRARMLYPCVVGCTDPNQGALEVTPYPRRDEHVTVRNVSSHAVDLYGYELVTQYQAHAFAAGEVLQLGQSLRVDFSPMRDSDGFARVSAFNGITLACTPWGSGRC